MTPFYKRDLHLFVIKTASSLTENLPISFRPFVLFMTARATKKCPKMSGMPNDFTTIEKFLLRSRDRGFCNHWTNEFDRYWIWLCGIQMYFQKFPFVHDSLLKYATLPSKIQSFGQKYCLKALWYLTKVAPKNFIRIYNINIVQKINWTIFLCSRNGSKKVIAIRNLQRSSHQIEPIGSAQEYEHQKFCQLNFHRKDKCCRFLKDGMLNGSYRDIWWLLNLTLVANP